MTGGGSSRGGAAPARLHARRSAALALALSAAACVEPSVTLPSSWNTLKRRALTVDVFAPEAAPNDVVKGLSGLDGAPIGLAEGAPDVTHAYWNRPPGSEERDGAHVDVVRVGASQAAVSTAGCALALQGMFPDPADAARDALGPWQAQMDAAAAAYPELVVWQAAFASTDAGCGPRPERAPEAWAGAVARALAARQPGLVEVLSPATLAEPGGLPLYAALARVAHGQAIPVAGGGFGYASAAEVADDPALGAFLDGVGAGDLPLDVLTFEARAETPQAIAAIAMALRARLDAAGLGAVGLAPTAFGPTPPITITDPSLVSAEVGAFEMATRVALQDVPGLQWAVSGPGAPPSLYFDAAGAPTPAFMARFPMRQIAGQARVHAEAPADLVAVASVEGRKLHVLVAAWDVRAGVGSIDYELTVPAFVPPVTDHVDYALAELDAGNDTLESFFFSDLGAVAPDPASGDVRFARTIPVPGIHYLELERPEFAPRRLAPADGR